MANFAGVDYVILIILAISVITGLFRGFVKELMALGIWGLAIWGGVKFAGLAASFLKPWIVQQELRLIAAFALIAITILLAGGLITSLLAFLIERSGLSGTDRLLGMIFGFARAVCIISLIILVARMTGFPQEKYSKNSKLFNQFLPAVDWMSAFAPQWLSKIKSLDKFSENTA